MWNSGKRWRMHHLPNLFAIESVSHSAVLVLMFHNQDLGNTQLLNVSRIKHGPRSRQSRQEKPISPNLAFLQFLCSGATVWGQESLPQVWVAVPLPMGVRGQISTLLFLPGRPAGDFQPISHHWRNNKWTVGMRPWAHCPTCASGRIYNPKASTNNRSHRAPRIYAGPMKFSREC